LATGAGDSAAPAPAAAIISAIKDGKFDIISVMPNFLLLNDAGNRLTAR
jgi:hypothetical protein